MVGDDKGRQAGGEAGSLQEKRRVGSSPVTFLGGDRFCQERNDIRDVRRVWPVLCMDKLKR